MGKASSGKKVARAARAGAAIKGRERRSLGFPLVVALVVLLGSSLVLYARSTRTDALPPLLNTVSAGSGDYHWHSAIGIYKCNQFVPNAIARGEGWPDPTGIHTHDDGIIHIHPFVSGATGSRARLKVFFQTMQLDFSDTELQLTDGTSLKAGDECDGKKAVLKVARYNANAPDQAPEIITEDLGDIRFLADKEAFTIALVPEDVTDIPIAPSASQIDALAGADGGQAAPTPGATTVPVETTAPGATTDPGSHGARRLRQRQGHPPPRRRLRRRRRLQPASPRIRRDESSSSRRWFWHAPAPTDAYES